MTIAITSAAYDAIVAACAATPYEACGLLFGSPARIDVAEPCRNVAVDPARAFEVDPAALIAAHRRARAGGAAIIGCFHSHPTGRVEPSAIDFAAAEPGAYWMIVAGDRMALWRRELVDFSACTFALL